MPSRFSQRWTVVTSRFRYAAISFHESRRSSFGRNDAGVPETGSPIVTLLPGPRSSRAASHRILTTVARHGKGLYSTALPHSCAMQFDATGKLAEHGCASPSSDAKEKGASYAWKTELVPVAQRHDLAHGRVLRGKSLGYNCEWIYAHNPRKGSAGIIRGF